MPVCGRCLRLGRGRRCQYVDAPEPLRRRKHPNDPPPSLLSPPISATSPLDRHSRNASISDIATPNGLVATAATNLAQSSTPAENSYFARQFADSISVSRKTAEARQPDRRVGDSPQFNRHSAGYLGSTSFHSVFTEDLPRFGIPLEEDRALDESVSLKLTPERLREGVKVLSLLQDRQLIERLFKQDERMWDVTDSLSRMWFALLWWSHADTLSSGDPKRMEKLVREIFANTTRLKHHKDMTMQEWAKQAALRWESIGIVLGYIGCLARSLMPCDSVFHDTGNGVDRAALINQYMEATESCVTFCKMCERMNDLTLWLLMWSDAVLMSVLGEAAPPVYIRSGEIISVAIALGLTNIREDDSTPRFLLECRKMSIILVLQRETGKAVFLGRPPRLNYKHCRITLPLDIEPTTWFRPDAEIDEAIARLDSKGWNPDGYYHVTTWTRKQYYVASQRQEILNLALTQQSKEEVLLEAARIRSQLLKDDENLPEFLRNADYVLNGPLNTPFNKMLRKTMEVGRLGNDLLLQRVLVQKGVAESSSLITPARRVFGHVLLLTTTPDLLRDIQSEMSWLLLSYGVRTAAILALELLKQELVPGYTQDQDHLPRSKTIQDLSVFVSCLDRLDQSDGNWQLCQQAAKILRKILDRVLTPSPVTLASVAHVRDQNQGQVAGVDTTFDGMLGLAPTQLNFETNVNLANDADFVNWLENINWDQDLAIA